MQAREKIDRRNVVIGILTAIIIFLVLRPCGGETTGGRLPGRERGVVLSAEDERRESTDERDRGLPTGGT